MYTYMHTITINGKDAINLMEGREGLEIGRGREKCN